MGFRTVTADELFATSTKKRCQATRQHFIDAGDVEKHDRTRRHPDTCLSRVLTLAEADSLWESRNNPPSLLGDMGMCIYSYGDPLDTKVVFLTDDSNYGWKILKDAGWFAMSYRWRGTSHQEFASWREHVEHFYRSSGTLKVIESVHDLLKHLNEEEAQAL